MNVYYKIRETTTSNIEKAQYIKCHISKYLSNLKKKKVRELGMKIAKYPSFFLSIPACHFNFE
jgi:hypothetical protein